MRPHLHPNATLIPGPSTDRQDFSFHPTIIHSHKAMPKKMMQFKLNSKETPAWPIIDNEDPSNVDTTPPEESYC